MWKPQSTAARRARRYAGAALECGGSAQGVEIEHPIVRGAVKMEMTTFNGETSPSVSTDASLDTATAQARHHSVLVAPLRQLVECGAHTTHLRTCLRICSTSVELETGKNPDAAVLWLHGLAPTATIFVPIVEEMRLPAAPAIRLHLSARAGAPRVTRQQRHGECARGTTSTMRTLRPRRHDGGARVAGADRSAALRANERAAFRQQRMVIAGFSQGGGDRALRPACGPCRVAGGHRPLSTYLVGVSTLAAEATLRIAAASPIFMAHGTHCDRWLCAPRWGDAVTTHTARNERYRCECTTVPDDAALVVWEERGDPGTFLLPRACCPA
jgi:phospholipase/carboxylesterase